MITEGPPLGGAEKIRLECNPTMSVVGVLELEKWIDRLIAWKVCGGSDPLGPGKGAVVCSIWSEMERTRRDPAETPIGLLLPRLSARR